MIHSKSPNIGTSVAINIDSGAYAIPICLLEGTGILQYATRVLPHRGAQLTLPYVNGDIGYTIIHYLFTGAYRTEQPEDVIDIPLAQLEYTRSVKVYHVAKIYSLHKLCRHAKANMRRWEKQVPIVDILNIVVENYPSVSNDFWLPIYLTRIITNQFQEDETLFAQKGFLDCFGKAVDFDRFLAGVMAETYSERLAAVRRGPPPVEIYNRPEFVIPSPPPQGPLEPWIPQPQHVDPEFPPVKIEYRVLDRRAPLTQLYPFYDNAEPRSSQSPDSMVITPSSSLG